MIDTREGRTRTLSVTRHLIDSQGRTSQKTTFVPAGQQWDTCTGEVIVSICPCVSNIESPVTQRQCFSMCSAIFC